MLYSKEQNLKQGVKVLLGRQVQGLKNSSPYNNSMLEHVRHGLRLKTSFTKPKGWGEKINFDTWDIRFLVGQVH
jgi:hypothetical protein